MTRTLQEIKEEIADLVSKYIVIEMKQISLSNEEIIYAKDEDGYMDTILRYMAHEMADYLYNSGAISIEEIHDGDNEIYTERLYFITKPGFINLIEAIVQYIIKEVYKKNVDELSSDLDENNK